MDQLSNKEMYRIYRSARESHLAYKVGELISSLLLLAVGVDFVVNLVHQELPSVYTIPTACLLVLCCSICSKQKQSKYSEMKKFEPFI